jgi:ERCC4-type nuclease
MENKKTINIIVDSRERNGPLPLMEGKISEIKDIPLSWEEKQITIGDFHIMQEGIIKIMIERKTWADLAASIIDQRANNQLKKMINFRKETGATLIYIIEGNKPRTGTHGVNMAGLQTKIRHIALESIHCAYTKTPEETVDLLIQYSRDLVKRDIISDFTGGADLLNSQKSESVAPKSENQKVDSIKKQESILSQRLVLSTKEQADLMWRQIPGIGENTALFLSKFTSIGNFLRLSDDGAKKLIAMLNVEKKTTSIRIGDKKLNELMELRADRKDDIWRLQKIELHADILSCINGIGKATAKAILKNYTLRDLANNPNILELEEFVISNEPGKKIRKLGNKMANRIVEVLGF